MKIYLPEKTPKESLIRWLKSQAKRILTQATAERADEMGIEYKSVGITSARGRWGSCSGDNAIHYSFRLLFVPKEVVEYVVVHELAHVKYKNHAKAFWGLVAQYVPDWKEKRRYLKSHGGLMEIL